MKDSKVERSRQQAVMFGRQFLQGDGSVFDQALGADAMAAAISTQAPGGRERIYAPLDTLRLFVGQVLSADRACQDVVGRRLSERIAQGQSESALTTGSYCDARQRLPLAMPVTLGSALGAQLEAMAPAHWRWQGRSVKLFDGSIVSMPDTASNQQAYPQSHEQKPGLGFPIAPLARSSVWPVAQCSAIKSSPAKARARVNKRYWETCSTISTLVMSCWPMRCWRPGGSLRARFAGATM